MENSLNNKESFLEIFRRSFPDLELFHEVVEFKGNINVFILPMSTEEQLQGIWKKVRDLIAMYFQSKLNSEFERWNIYLIFISSPKISNELKYKIENDPLSSRKIVLDGFQGDINAETINNLIGEHIKNELNSPENEHAETTQYCSNSPIHKAITKKKAKLKDKAMLEKLFDEIIAKLKDED